MERPNLAASTKAPVQTEAVSVARSALRATLDGVQVAIAINAYLTFSLGAGETVIGISYSTPGVKAINDGAPIKIILPEEGLGWEIEATARVILRVTKVSPRRGLS